MSYVKEVIISLLACLVVLIGLSLAFYKFIPNNKIIPETITYQASEEIQKELKTEVQNDSDKIVKTYEITASDLEKYQANKEYVPGKKNPFAPASSGESGSGSDTGSSSNGSSSNNGGSLFEKPGTK